jgi:hypothetical protein
VLLNTTVCIDVIQRPDTNEVEVNVDLLTGRAFREAVALTNTILPDIVLASSNRRSGVVKASAAAAAAPAYQGSEE